jgi:hypothetical protein
VVAIFRGLGEQWCHSQLPCTSGLRLETLLIEIHQLSLSVIILTNMRKSNTYTLLHNIHQSTLLSCSNDYSRTLVVHGTICLCKVLFPPIEKLLLHSILEVRESQETNRFLHPALWKPSVAVTSTKSHTFPWPFLFKLP